MTPTSNVGQQFLGKYCCLLLGFTCILSGFVPCFHSFYSHTTSWLCYVLIWGILGIVWTVRFYFIFIQKSEEENSGCNQRTCKVSTIIVCELCRHFISLFYYNTSKQLKPASDYKLIRRFRLSRRCRSSCRDFRLAIGTLRLADYLRCVRSDWQLIIGDPSAN